MDKVKEKIIINSSTNMDIDYLKQAILNTKVIFFDKNINPKQRIIIKNIIEQIDTLPECEILSCRNMNLEKLPKLPICRVLFISNNKLKKLPNLPNMYKLIASRNELINLPKLDLCSRLFVEKNNLETLPKLPNVKTLICRSNKLKLLPELPKCVKLVCSNNKLKKLPKLPVCKYLDCSFNNIQKLPDLPIIDVLITKGNNELKEKPSQKREYNRARQNAANIIIPTKEKGTRIISKYLNNNIDYVYLYKTQKYKQKFKKLKNKLLY